MTRFIQQTYIYKYIFIFYKKGKLKLIFFLASIAAFFNIKVTLASIPYILPAVPASDSPTNANK